MKFGKTEIAKQKFYVAKIPIQIWVINVDSIASQNWL